jgi:response regulator RpfG family c-di-GMP phosphodiesterase
MKKIYQFFRWTKLQRKEERLRRSHAQNVMMARDLARLHASHTALLRNNTEGQLGITSFAVIKHLTVLLQLRDYENYRHGVRVARLSSILAHQMQLDQSYCAMLELATPLHDIGMLALPDSSKSEDVASRREYFENHTLLGESILKSDDHLLSISSQIARSHHEHFDGSGYPDRLIGDGIPLGARIVAVADRFDDLLYGLHGNSALSADEAYKVIFDEYGRRFDPKVVRSLDQGKEEFMAAMASEASSVTHRLEGR